jgi:hypothetical protein
MGDGVGDLDWREERSLLWIIELCFYFFVFLGRWEEERSENGGF